MRDWLHALDTLGAAGVAAVLVTVVATRGSVPRAPGTRMLVTADATEGTIGGGHLEFKAIAVARDLLASAGPAALHRFALGATLGQCCGGVAHLLFEPVCGRASWIDALLRARSEDVDCALVTPLDGDAAERRLVVTATWASGTLGAAPHDDAAIAAAREALLGNAGAALRALDAAGTLHREEYFIDLVRQPNFRIVLFGAGHVGRALVGVLARLDCRIVWVDTRDDAFPAAIPANVECITTDTPDVEIAAAPRGAYFLVMTHSHPQDEALAERILARGDFAYFGLIGSNSKRRQFEKRLLARGTPRASLDAMTCPIGIGGITGKEPEVIAIAVAAELLQVRSRRATTEVGQGSRCA
jgi:xanthine dehydrogenase accessory factor